MTEKLKKVSFGFSKHSKQRTTLIQKGKTNDKIQYIDCLESNSIKVKGNPIQTVNSDLIIPVKGCKASIKTITTSSSLKSGGNVNDDEAGDKEEESESLDAIAAREILQDLKKVKSLKDDNVLVLQVPGKTDVDLEKEPTAEDYEAVPIEKFGLAMLRGMGWVPEKGIGKNEKVVPTIVPVLRPKGVGLGADRLSTPSSSLNVDKDGLKVVKGAFVRILSGAHKDLYGQIEGFSDQGRVIIKSTLGRGSISVNEYMIKAVSENEYKKHSRVLNLSKYEETVCDAKDTCTHSNSHGKRSRTE